MSLRKQAAADAKAFLEDANGFGWPVMITDPDGVTADLHGWTSDISETIDPETGQAVMGRVASVALAIKSLTDKGMGIPRGQSDGAKKPWVVVFDDIEGCEHAFKVIEAMPDRAAGVVTCRLEAYR